jgi:hypothetical protein
MARFDGQPRRRILPDHAGQRVARALDVALANPAGPVFVDCLADDTRRLVPFERNDVRRASSGFTFTLRSGFFTRVLYIRALTPTLKAARFRPI